MSRVDAGALNDLMLNMMQTGSRFSVSNSSGFSSAYAKILAEKLAQVDDEMNAAAESQNQILNSETSQKTVEVIKRFKPDGSIMITTYKDGKIADIMKIKPHMVPVPDFSAPKTPEGDTAIKMVPRLSLTELLMM